MLSADQQFYKKKQFLTKLFVGFVSSLLLSIAYLQIESDSREKKEMLLFVGVIIMLSFIQGYIIYEKFKNSFDQAEALKKKLS